MDFRVTHQHSTEPCTKDLYTAPVAILSVLKPLNDGFTSSSRIVLIGELLGHIHLPIERQKFLGFNVQDPVREEKLVVTFVPIFEDDADSQLLHHVVDEVHAVAIRQQILFHHLEFIFDFTFDFDVRKLRPETFAFVFIKVEAALRLAVAQVPFPKLKDNISYGIR